MKRILYVYDKDTAEQHAFGPYNDLYSVQEAEGTLNPDDYDTSIIELNHLSEDMDNPGGALFFGDSPD